MRLLSRVRDERGFTMIVVMLVLMVTTLFSVAAYNSVASDRTAGRYSQDQKLAYSAAQSGLAWYQIQLAKDPSYWTQCQSVPQLGSPAHNAPVWDGLAAHTRTWADVNLPNAAYTGAPATLPATAQTYNVELLPVNGQNACDTSNPDTTMIDVNGTFRLRVSGHYGAATRAIVATFRRKGFLDYLYYTQYETLDPSLAIHAAGLFGWQTRLSLSDPTTFASWAASNCADKPYAQRSGKTYSLGGAAGWFDPPSGYPWTQFTSAPPCTDVSFSRNPATGVGDQVSGPLHTGDPLLVCGNPIFGTAASDRIEVEASPSTRNAATEGLWGCSGAWGSTPQFTGTLIQNAAAITPPLPNSNLASSASSCCLFQGETRVVLDGVTGNMTVYNAARYPNGKSMPQPANGVIYASTSGACAGYKPENSDGDDATCGDIRVQGQATQSITFGADNDVVVTGDLKPAASAPNALIGLIAQGGYVRVFHPVGAATNNTTYGWLSAGQGASTQIDSSPVGQPRNYCAPNNSASPAVMNSITIQAAILALSHSFMVDNWRCGTQMTGSLNIIGAIAQKYRGPAGCNGCKPPGLTATGYVKNYTYDTRLKYRSPPSFLAPVQAAWRTVRVQEQAGAAGIAGR